MYDEKTQGILGVNANMTISMQQMAYVSIPGHIKLELV
jgi:hypothetical protein